MTIQEINQRLKENGIEVKTYTLRRRIDTYLNYPTRNQRNNQRDITQEEFKTLLLALALESKGKSKENIEDYLSGKVAKTDLMGLLIDSNRVNEILRGWIEE